MSPSIDFSSRFSRPISDDLLERLRRSGLSDEQLRRVRKKIEETLTYVAKVGVLGKTGVGKSRLCNALFGADVAEIDDVRACTREPDEFILSLSDRRIVLVDVPGVGESGAADAKYAELYRNLIPKLDLVLWLVKSDDRALAIDQYFQEAVVRPALGEVPLLAVISQAEKMEPMTEWDRERHVPGPRQDANLAEKAKLLSESLELSVDQVIAVSAAESYRLDALLERMVHLLPDEKKVGVVREAEASIVSPKAAEGASEGFFRSILKAIREIARSGRT